MLSGEPFVVLFYLAPAHATFLHVDGLFHRQSLVVRSKVERDDLEVVLNTPELEGD